MTGPAHHTRHILIAVLVLSMLNSAQANSPRDAIKHLKFSHTSDFSIVENDNIQQPAFNDRYGGRWKFTFAPPKVSLPSGVKASFDLLYELSLADANQLNAGVSNNKRLDHYRFALQLKGMSKADFNYAFDETDIYQDGGIWITNQTLTTNLALYPPGLPAVSVGYSTNRNINRKDGNLTSGSENDALVYSLEYKRDKGAFGQQIKARNEVRRIRNYPVLKGTNESRTQISGYRTIPLKQAGNLKFIYDYASNQRSSLGSLDPDQTTTNLYGLELSNRLNFMPVDYAFYYSNKLTRNPNSVMARSDVYRRFNMNYNLPVPNGKNLVLSFKKEMTEEEQGSRRNSFDHQFINLNMKFNPRTTGWMQHHTFTAVNLAAKVTTEKREELTARSEYKIPGNQGSISGEFSQASVISPQRNQHNVNKKFALNNQFRLGDNASFNFFYQQNYGESESIVPESSVETTLSGFQYHLGSKSGVSLDARWQSRLRINSVASKNHTQEYQVQLKYNTPANWRYEFIINQNGTQDVSVFRPNSDEYRSSNEILFRVTYSF